MKQNSLPPLSIHISKTIFGKVKSLFTSILFCSIVFSVLLSSCQKHLEKETYLIPKDFEGDFRVIYGEKCGENPVKEDGRLVLKIPDSGILIIQTKFETGIIDNEYYYVDKNGTRQKINRVLDESEARTQSLTVLFRGTGEIAGAMPDGSFSSKSPTTIHYTFFTVFNTEGSKSKGQKSEEGFNDLVTSLVNECRKK